MKLVQNLGDKRIWNGVLFPRGVPVEIDPAVISDTDVVALISWGWEKVEEIVETKTEAPPEPIVSDTFRDYPEGTSMDATDPPEDAAPRRRPGRPRKNPVEE